MLQSVDYYLGKATSGELTDQEKNLVANMANEVVRYLSIAKGHSEPLDSDYQGGCDACGFGDPAVMEHITICPICDRK